MRIALIILTLTMTAACGGAPEDGSDGATDGASSQAGISQAEMENGIGPIESVSLGDIDEALAEQGEQIFTMKCSACHKMSARYVGPPMDDVMARRTPAYVMNMMLNPEEMLQKHPEARDMLAQYMTPMPNQQLTEDDARAVLEYLREETEESHSE